MTAGGNLGGLEVVLDDSHKGTGVICRRHLLKELLSGHKARHKVKVHALVRHTVNPLLEVGVLLQPRVEIQLSSQGQAPGLVRVHAEGARSARGDVNRTLKRQGVVLGIRIADLHARETEVLCLMMMFDTRESEGQ